MIGTECKRSDCKSANGKCAKPRKRRWVVIVDMGLSDSGLGNEEGRTLAELD
jgi:hypothetical protein